jgi:Pyruvate/2-oxoacid:ferredoxin oxidoreductase gamma subunit
MAAKNIIITGMGGQGVLYLSSIMRRALLNKYGAITGYDNRGGAQRLGHVASIIRFDDGRGGGGGADYGFNADGGGAAGNGINETKKASQQSGPAFEYALDFDDGACDYALSLEASELLKFNAKLSGRSLIITDEFIMAPTNIRRADAAYFKFSELKRHFTRIVDKFIHCDFRGEAKKISGGAQAANLLLLGRFIAVSGGPLELEDIYKICGGEDFELIKRGAQMEN